jgi:ribonucleotide monophosphatase NagD (HAD superfamily)
MLKEAMGAYKPINPYQQSYLDIQQRQLEATASNQQNARAAQAQHLQQQIFKAADDAYQAEAKLSADVSNPDCGYLKEAETKYGQAAVKNAFVQAAQTGRHWSEFLGQPKRATYDPSSGRAQ